MLSINNNPINFNGGFRFRNMPIEAKNKIPEISKKWMQVFYDFENKNDVFLVARDKLDVKVSKFIKENNLKFEYYKDITTKSGLDTEEPEKLNDLIKKQVNPPITTLTQLSKSISKQIIAKKVEENSAEYVGNILKALKINPDTESKIIKGINVIDNPEFERKIYISRRGKDKIHYVLIEPYSKNNPSERYTINSDGKILEKYNTPDKIKEFYKNFRKSVL